MSNLMKHNEEYREAEQAALDAKNKELREQFDGKFDHKFKAVEQALQILSDNDIRCYIFASLPSLYSGEKEGIWQYNNHDKYIKYEGGVSTLDSKMKTGIFNTMFLAAFYSWLKECGGGVISDIPAEVLGNHIKAQYDEAIKWLYNDVLPSQVQKLLDDGNSLKDSSKK